MKQKHEIHMLPTELGSGTLGVYKYGKILGFGRPISTIHGATFQHLYITSDEKIKEGDWFIDLEKGTAVHWTMSYPFPYQGSQLHRKIIATTDPKLLTYVGENYSGTIVRQFGKNYKRLPQPPQSFVKLFCEKGGIDKVMVEYEEVNPKAMWNNAWRLKLINNTIVISEVEERMYSKEEVISLIRKFSEYADDQIDHEGINSACCSIGCCDWDEEEWIKENL